MGTCKDCRFWDDYSYAAYMNRRKPDNHKRCDAVETRGAKGISLEIYASDDTGLEGDLITGPDFGCVLFSPKQ